MTTGTEVRLFDALASLVGPIRKGDRRTTYARLPDATTESGYREDYTGLSLRVKFDSGVVWSYVLSDVELEADDAPVPTWALVVTPAMTADLERGPYGAALQWVIDGDPVTIADGEIEVTT